MDENGKPFMTRRTRKSYDKAWELARVAIEEKRIPAAAGITLSASICGVSAKRLLRLYVARKNETIEGGSQLPCWV